MAVISSKLNNDAVLSQLRDMQTQMRQLSKTAGSESAETDDPARDSNFIKLLRDNVEDVNNMQKTADKMATDLAIGKSQNLHETMLAATKAELSFNFMVQIRNKILEAYQDVMRMQL